MWYFIFSIELISYSKGDCAKHFQLILERHPPQVNSRQEAMEWACKVHNLVNERLKKPLFDCSKIADVWKCGCADDDVNLKKDEDALLD